ncbi:MAG: hypothetical protein J6X86_04170 [Bacteroidales bacterium]|nr:hypothetical protein [Bacteroidales bacterium]
MKKRLIYLQSGFWKKIRKCDSVEDKRMFWDLYGALECCNIKADFTSSEWAEDKDDLLYYLLQSSSDGNGTKIEFCATENIQEALDYTKEQSIENLCAAFLLDEETRVCLDRSKELGVLCLNSDMIKEHKFVRGDAVMYEKGEMFDRFDKCKTALASPCNAIILIDPYILFNKWSVELNLIPLMDKCLPPDPKRQDDQKIDFHLSILSQTNQCFIGKYKDILRYEKIYDYVKEEIRKIRPNMKLKFTLYHTNTTGNGDGDFHSRHLVTNCMLVNSEDGFDFFENKKNEYTGKWETVSGKHARLEFLYPTLLDNRRLDADNYYRWITLSANNCVDNSLCWGDKENRLFELV